MLQRKNAGEFFATTMQAIERRPEFVRLTFLSDRQIVTITLTPAAFAMVAGMIAGAGQRVLH